MDKQNNKKNTLDAESTTWYGKATKAELNLFGQPTLIKQWLCNGSVIDLYAYAADFNIAPPI